MRERRSNWRVADGGLLSHYTSYCVTSTQCHGLLPLRDANAHVTRQTFPPRPSRVSTHFHLSVTMSPISLFPSYAARYNLMSSLSLTVPLMSLFLLSPCLSFELVKLNYNSGRHRSYMSPVLSLIHSHQQKKQTVVIKVEAAEELLYNNIFISLNPHALCSRECFHRNTQCHCS